ncbi:YwmB family TATA-box binding protein [Bacillus sp. FJAT-47783]|uniref:YwmB family TATA-box binding protein n=1 Tax=Bacillus sp. FJAT-47783 TaxID=2922712 RepID=UPI001FAD35A4|nr:YwmB family TATA-box binding protein [Bacillus sp. FJAT-47783]
MKKKDLMLLIIVFVLILTFLGKQTMIDATSDQTNVKTIVDGLRLENISVDEWSVYVKQPIQGQENISKHVQLFQQQFRQYNWSQVQEEHVTKWIGKRKRDDLNLHETLQIVTTTINSHSQSYILYHATVHGWQEKKWGELNRYFNEKILRKMNGNAKIFTCVKGHTSDKMEGVLQIQAEKILDRFRAKPIEALTESNFVSVSGLTSDWEQVIPTDEGNMNIQVALRNAGLGGNTTVVVGTPIITTEY